MTIGAKQKREPGFFRWLRVVDDGVFAVEQAIVALALIAITVLMFVNVLARRIQAQDSKVGAVIADLAGVDSIADLETRRWIDANVAPWVTLVGSFALIAFGYYTWQRFVRRRKKLEPARLLQALPMGGVVAVVVVGAGWAFAYVFTLLESSVIFAGLFGASALGFVAWVIKSRPQGYVIKAISGLVGGAGVVWFCLSWFPIGYTWTFKVSLMLLLWVGMLGASVCVHEGKHIRMEALGKLAPEGARRYITALGFLVAALFAGVMAWLGVLYTFEPVASNDPELPQLVSLFGTRYVMGPTGAYGLEGAIEGTDIPDWVGTFSVVIGFGLATFRFFAASVSWAIGGEYGAPAPDEGMEEARAIASESHTTEEPS